MSGDDAIQLQSGRESAGAHPSCDMQGATADQALEVRLVRQSLEGDLDAFGKLVALHRSRVFSMLVQIVRNEEDAWDIAQEGFVKAWRALHTFKGDSAFFTWLFRITRNLAIDHLRKRERRAETRLDETYPSEAAGASPAASPAKHTDSPDERAWQSEIASRIDKALGELSDEHREVIVLRELHGLDYNEIASVMGCSVGTVMSRLFYARKKLQNLLRDLYENL